MSAPRERPIEYRRLRAPRGQGDQMIEPPLQNAGAVVTANRAILSSVQLEIGGESFAAVRLAARTHLLAAARTYTEQYRKVPADEYSPTAPLVLAGHQPELFHPGVWFKNVVLSQIGEQLGAPAVNLIIDGDTLATPAIRVLSGSLEHPRVEAVTFDRPAELVPYEERRVVDQTHFASFASRVKQAGGAMLPSDLLLERIWPTAVDAVKAGHPLGEAIARARHALEAGWGMNTLEVPLSQVCTGTAFRRFLLHILANLPRFVAIYNEALAEYRTVHKLRSRSHPAPNLEQREEFLEAPFWIWSTVNPRRGRLHVRRSGNTLELRDLEVSAHRMELPFAGEPTAALHLLAQHEHEGLKLRPRALLTTMFARLFLGDLFLHGIGGAKYDQLTDAIIRRFFGIEPSQYMTVTATVYPPLEVPQVNASDLTHLAQQERALEYHPEKFIDIQMQPAAEPWIFQKKQALALDADGEKRAQRHRAIEEANQAMQIYVAQQRDKLSQQTAKMERALRVTRQIHVREWSFGLFSEEFLRPLLLDQRINTA